MIVEMSDASGTIKTTTTGAGGFYKFEAVAAGETYVFTVAGKRFQFAQPTQVVNVGEEEREINFISND